MEEILVYFSIKYNGSFDRVYEAITSQEEIDQDDFRHVLSNISCNYTTILSSDYPECFKSIVCPPLVLFYYGDLSLIDKNRIGVIGMRDCSDYGRKACQFLVGDLVEEGYVIVSGLARGIDGEAARVAIEGGGKTIAILGSGIDYCYPKRHQTLYDEIKENHLIISEYPGYCAPTREHFPARNRIIAALSSKLLVVEADVRSGTMITVGFALEQGKEVYSVPNTIFGHQGCNELISMGAKLVRSAKDIIDD